MRLMLARSVAC